MVRYCAIIVFVLVPVFALAQSPDDLQRQRDVQQAYKENLDQYTIWQRDLIDQLMVEKARLQATVKQLERELDTCQSSHEEPEKDE